MDGLVAAGLFLSMAAVALPALLPLVLKREAVLQALQHTSKSEEAAAPLRVQLEELRARMTVADGLRQGQQSSVSLAAVVEALSAQLPDDTSLDRLEISASDIRISGITGDVADLTAQLARHAEFADVIHAWVRVPVSAWDALRDKYALPGMSVLQFSFDHFEDNPHKPQNVRENTVYYTGTHDNDTLLGWFNSLDAAMQQHVLQSLAITDVSALTTAMLDTVFASNALLALVPLQDLLQLDNAARMNVPGTVDGNWQWRFQWSQLPENLASVLHESLLHHQRLGNTPP